MKDFAIAILLIMLLLHDCLVQEPCQLEHRGTLDYPLLAP